jgi:hypothetical protein
VPTPRFFRTAIFRLSAINGVVFALCLLILLIASYWTATAVLRDQIRSTVQDEIDELSSQIGDDVNEIAGDIDERLGLSPKPADYYYFADSAGKKVAGNLEKLDGVPGWRETAIDPAPQTAGQGEPDDHELWGIGKRLPDGSFLFVGQDAYRVILAQEAIIDAFAWSAGIAFLLAALAGIAVSRGFLRRIDAINTTSRAIIEGNQGTRAGARNLGRDRPPVGQPQSPLRQQSGAARKPQASRHQYRARFAHAAHAPASGIGGSPGEREEQEGL